MNDITKKDKILERSLFVRKLIMVGAIGITSMCCIFGLSKLKTNDSNLLIENANYRINAENGIDTGALEDSTLVSVFHLSSEELSIEDTITPTVEPTVAPTTEPTATPVPTKTPSKYDSIGICTVNTLNIRKEANSESALIGKMSLGAFANIQSINGEWAYITSGNAKGYVNINYLAIGEAAESIAKKYVTKTATITSSALKLRKEMSTESEVLAKLAKGSSFKVLSETEEWVKVTDTDTKQTGYVSKQYVSIKEVKQTAITIEEEKKQKEEEARKKAEEEAAKKAEEERIAEEKRKEEEAKRLEEQKKKEEAEKKKAEEAAKRAESENKVKLLACLIYTEAGSESYEGKLAVASVIMNRVKSSRYPNTIYKVIYQPGQFSPAYSGSLQRQLDKYSSYKTKNQLECIKAAKAAIAGQNNIGNRTSFRPISSVDEDSIKNALVIDGHVFY